MNQDDYIILFDENGSPYIAHASWQGIKNTVSNAVKGVGRGVRQNHKYLLKVLENGKARYFYTQEEVKAYYNEKKNAAKNKIKDIVGYDEKERLETALKNRNLAASAVKNSEKHVEKVQSETSRLHKTEYEKARLSDANKQRDKLLKVKSETERAYEKAQKEYERTPLGMIEKARKNLEEREARRVAKKNTPPAKELLAKATAALNKAQNERINETRSSKSLDSMEKQRERSQEINQARSERQAAKYAYDKTFSGKLDTLSDKLSGKARKTEKDAEKRDAARKLAGGRIDPNAPPPNSYLYARGNNSGFDTEVTELSQLETDKRKVQTDLEILKQDKSRPAEFKGYERVQLLIAQSKAEKAYKKAYDDLIRKINRKYDTDLADYEKKYGKLNQNEKEKSK